MVGPSSSHTAGAARIGQVARKLLGEPVVNASIYFHGSFLATGKGHGTDRAVIAGLLGYGVDDDRIPDSFKYAKEAGLTFTIEGKDLGDVHPNSVKMYVEGRSGKKIELMAASIGGGRIEVRELDGIAASFSGEQPTLVIHHRDKPGLVTDVTYMLSKQQINIASMQLYRKKRGGESVLVIESDQEVPENALDEVKKLDKVIKVAYLPTEENIQCINQ